MEINIRVLALGPFLKCICLCAFVSSFYFGGMQYEAVGHQVEQLGLKDKITIAKIDATANSWPKSRFPVPGFPTIYFVPSLGGTQNAAPIPYEGPRLTYDMLRFIQQHSTYVPSYHKHTKNIVGEHCNTQLIFRMSFLAATNSTWTISWLT